MMGKEQQVVARVEEILTNHFDNVEYASDGFTLRKGSARGFVEVYSPAGNGHREPPTFVRITVPLLQQVPETPAASAYRVQRRRSSVRNARTCARSRARHVRLLQAHTARRLSR